MNKEEFKEFFKELCKSREITMLVEGRNDGYQYLVFKIDNEVIFEEPIIKK